MNITATASLAQQFRAEYAKGVVPAMLKGIKAAKRDTRLIIAAVLAITYHHQAHWLSTINGIGILGWVIPAVVDLAMLRMLGIVQLDGNRKQAKKGALWMTAALVTMSATVNIAAPGEIAARLIFGALVLIAGGVKVVTSLVGPDFDEMEEKETAVAPAATGPTAQEIEAAQRRSEIAKRAAAKRAANKAEAERKAEEKRAERRARAAAKRLEELAPSSPGHPAVILSAADKEALAHLAAKR